MNWLVVWLGDRYIGVVESGRLCVRGDIWGLERRTNAVDAARCGPDKQVRLLPHSKRIRVGILMRHKYSGRLHCRCGRNACANDQVAHEAGAAIATLAMKREKGDRGRREILRCEL